MCFLILTLLYVWFGPFTGNNAHQPLLKCKDTTALHKSNEPEPGPQSCTERFIELSGRGVNNSGEIKPSYRRPKNRLCSGIAFSNHISSSVKLQGSSHIMLLIHLFFWTSRHPATQQTANLKPVHLSSQAPGEKLWNHRPSSCRSSHWKHWGN